MKTRRIWVVAFTIWNLAFAQAAMAAHACALLASQAPAQTMSMGHEPMPGCSEMARQSDSTANVCESHCLGVQQAQGLSDLPAPGIAPQPPLVLRLTEPSAHQFLVVSSFAPLAAAPPAQLRFGRFLI